MDAADRGGVREVGSGSGGGVREVGSGGEVKRGNQEAESVG